jgi:tRNA pseudouridine55 synthase
MTPQGILNMGKPEGSTSFQIVALVRKLSGVKKVGHAGTLDPTATGVLLICLGQAVRISEYLMELPKAYRGTVRLGVATDTYDAAGIPVFEGSVKGVSEEALRAALETLERQKQQVPPSHSAIKVGGTRAYHLARAGKPVRLPPRKARIERIDLISFAPPLVEMEVKCGKGTYIRTVADDLGRLLGCGAHLQALRRTAVGPFRVEDAISPERLETAFADGTWQELLLPLDRGLGHIPAAHLDAEVEQDVRRGRPLDASSPPFRHLLDPPQGERCRAYGEDGTLAAMLRYDADHRQWRPQKVFAPVRETC